MTEGDRADKPQSNKKAPSPALREVETDVDPAAPVAETTPPPTTKPRSPATGGEGPEPNAPD